MKFTLTILGIVLAVVSVACNAASVIILDEGINTDQKWNAQRVTVHYQMCSSFDTVFTREDVGYSPVFSYLSLCANQRSIQNDAAGASRYQNTRDYRAFGQVYTHTLFAKDHAGTQRGIHGNRVSNALYSFDATVIHRPVQVFGIELGPNSRRWRTSYVQVHKSYEEQDELPGWNIIRALDYISRGSESAKNGFDQLTDLGAINISVVLRGNFAEELCNGKKGQDSVNRLQAHGIAVVAGLDNIDIPVTERTWPQCLSSVVGVGGLASPGVGAGANQSALFFAKDTQDGVSGNSLAAPRVAAAYALLHERFPSSTLAQKLTALQAANKSRTRRTRVGNLTFPFIEKKNMQKAFSELAKMAPPAPIYLPNDFLDYSNIAFWGPVYGGAQSTADFTITLPVKSGAAARAVKNTPSATDTQTGIRLKTRLQGLPRDVLLEFTGAVHSNRSSAALRLWVNGREIAEFTGFPSRGEADAQFVINRNYLNTGNNRIEIRPFDAGNDWGVKDVRATYLPVIPLQLGVTDYNEYGYNGTPRYLTEIRASFNLNTVPSGGVELSMRGWDIDTSSEVAVLVNGRYAGRLSMTPNNRYGARDVLVVSPAKLRQGINYIELIQRQPDSQWSGTEDQQWAVKELTVKRLTVDNDSGSAVLPAIISLLLNE